MVINKNENNGNNNNNDNNKIEIKDKIKDKTRRYLKQIIFKNETKLKCHDIKNDKFTYE